MGFKGIILALALCSSVVQATRRVTKSEIKEAEQKLERSIRKSEVQWASIDGKDGAIIKDKTVDLRQMGMERMMDEFSLDYSGLFSYYYDTEMSGFFDETGSYMDFEFVGEWNLDVCNPTDITLWYLGHKSNSHEEIGYISHSEVKPGDCANFRLYGHDFGEARLYFATTPEHAQTQEIDFTLRFNGMVVSYDMLQTSGTYLSALSNIIAAEYSSSMDTKFVGTNNGVIIVDGMIYVDVTLGAYGSDYSYDYSYDWDSSYSFGDFELRIEESSKKTNEKKPETKANNKNVKNAKGFEVRM